MGATALRQLLKSLCSNSTWNYAVLWKLRHGSPMILTWEDGYFNYSKSRELVGTISDDVYGKGASDLVSPQVETNTSRGISEEYPVGLVVADMSHLQYIFGEGVVGKVAALRDHCWVSFHHIFTGKSELIPEQCPEEWLLQFASGIKTILLVPVLPYGVLQLGSLEEVAEDVSIVAYIKYRFNCLQSVGENTGPCSLKKESQAQLSSSLISSSNKCLNVPLTNILTSVKTEDVFQSIASNIVELGNDNLATASYVQRLVTFQDVFTPTGEGLPEAIIFNRDNKINVPLVEVSNPSVSINDSQLEMMESKLFDLSCLMEEIQAHSEELQRYSDYNGYNMGLLEESFNEIMNIHPAGSMTGEPCGDKYAIDLDNKIVSSFLRFPKDSELHKALEPASSKQTSEQFWDSSFMVENTCGTSSLPPSKDPNTSDRTEPSWFARGGDAGYLLEAVVANACHSSDDTICYEFKSLESSTSPRGSASPSPKNQYKGSDLAKDSSIPRNHLTSACITEDRNADSTSDTLMSMMNTILSQEHKGGGTGNTQLRKERRTLNSSKRRARPSDNQRQRPRDRQLIQERVKELRELVPNGAKCSIDGLLDRTIKHMMYLRSVTDQAEKLRHCLHQELAGCKNWRPSETEENYQNGTSWAFELGNEFQVCPIAVEDLAYPGHMLIEMLCDEHGLFLEIAQVIRGLGLTILKGVLKSRSSNTWARFVVEASKGFHRLDIFWPLMQLLQRKRKSISSKI
ncbi:transcription factor EMB1444 isoform X1 [Ricinus communis]|uniref:transcription factor EMB1444 isoform X1 n=1 Tax=Ricinus communis TaxID=3988 RepID=UPI00201A3793|nr:transcription factor EMB1444 isoform X1 [Ricinus communis]